MSTRLSFVILFLVSCPSLAQQINPLEISSDLNIAEAVSISETRYRRGNDFDCSATPTRSVYGLQAYTYDPNHLRNLPLNSQTTYITYDPYSNNGVYYPLKPLSRDEILALPLLWNKFRHVTVANSVSTQEDKSFEVNLSITDKIDAARPEDYESSCTHVVGSFVPEKDVTQGTIKLSYWLPDNVEIVKVEVLNGNAFLDNTHFAEVEGTFNPSINPIYLSQPYYVWADLKTIQETAIQQKTDAVNAQRAADAAADAKALANSKANGGSSYSLPYIPAKRSYPTVEYTTNDRRITLNIKIDATSTAHSSSVSNVRVKITPIYDQNLNLSYTDRLQALMKMINAHVASQDYMLTNFAYLVSHQDQITEVLKSFKLPDLSSLEQNLTEFALQGASSDKNFTPLVKALAALFANELGKNLAEKLLPICELLNPQYVPVIGTTFETQRYAYLFFNLNRIKARLIYYEPLNAYEIGNAIDGLRQKSLTYNDVASNSVLTQRLAKAYDVYKLAFSQNRNAMSTAEGEYTVISSAAPALLSQDLHHQRVVKLFAQGSLLELAVLKEIDDQKTLFNYTKPKTLINDSQLINDITRLEHTRKEILKEISLFTRDYLFSTTTSDDYLKALLESFSGLNLNGNLKANAEIEVFFEPIFRR